MLLFPAFSFQIRHDVFMYIQLHGDIKKIKQNSFNLFIKQQIKMIS